MRRRGYVKDPAAPIAASVVPPIATAEKVFVDINGARQGMFIQSADSGLPVLLYLHGGMPEYFLTERHPTGLEQHFTTVWQERRGAGLSYDPRISAATLTLDQLIADTLAVTMYLRERFGQDQIYLMAHSGGTFIGLQAAARAPELYRAYIGVAQMVRQLESERLAQAYMLSRFRSAGNRRMIRKLEAAPVSEAAGTPLGYLRVRDKAMHRLGIGTMQDMNSVVTGIFWPSVVSASYTLTEKVKLWRGKLASGVSVLWDDMLTTDLAGRVPELAMPAYFLHGRHDYTVSYQLAKDYADGLTAPLKGFYTFEQSAHSPVMEEPRKALRILCEDVLRRANALADGNN